MASAPIEWRIRVDGDETFAHLDPAQTARRAVFVAAHGAGSHKDHRSMLQLSTVLRAQGFDVVRFNFLYREKGGRAPDRMPKLQACFAAVTQHARAVLEPTTFILGGRSMGGRVASMLAADGFSCNGLLLFAYPLHPAGDVERLRAAHLTEIRVPVLCINGTRDALCTRELMDRAIAGLAWEMHWLEGKDHSFRVTAEVGALAGAWLERISRGS